MIYLSNKKFDEVYFLTKNDLTNLRQTSFCWNAEDDSRLMATQKHKTLFISLRQSPDDFLADMNKATRYDVNRCLSKDAPCFIYKTQPTDGDIEESLKMHAEVYHAKGICFEVDFYRMLYERVNRKNCLTISKVENSSEILSIHTYIHDERRVRLIASSSKRLGADSALVGRINKALHYSDFLHFKERNLSIYDFGGVSDESPQHHSISAFKRGFGGYEVDEFHGWLPTSVLGRIQILGKLAKASLKKQLLAVKNRLNL